jgi:hypothetical protein
VWTGGRKTVEEMGTGGGWKPRREEGGGWRVDRVDGGGGPLISDLRSQISDLRSQSSPNVRAPPQPSFARPRFGSLAPSPSSIADLHRSTGHRLPHSDLPPLTSTISTPSSSARRPSSAPLSFLRLPMSHRKFEQPRHGNLGFLPRKRTRHHRGRSRPLTRTHTPHSQSHSHSHTHTLTSSPVCVCVLRQSEASPAMTRPRLPT